jgi:hypothetical protein
LNPEAVPEHPAGSGICCDSESFRYSRLVFFPEHLQLSA